MPNVIECLKKRGLVEAITSEDLYTFSKKPIKVYAGFDPTADSLHLGNLLVIIVLAWFQRYGHTPVILLGGATGRIGDPSGKSMERPLLDSETLAVNMKGIAQHFEKILDFSNLSTRPMVFNNEEWFSRYSFVDFLRDIGKSFRINAMLAKESVRSRLESEEGMSFTEFSYQLLQAYDFFHLSAQHQVSLQIGGSDQWGNITSGIELIRKLSGTVAFGLTFPLLTRSDGKKFGKTEEGAIWLSPERLSPYRFYQYLVRIPDADVIKLMRMLTFMDLGEIAEYEQQMQKSECLPNTAQRRFAEEVTRIVHGEMGVAVALRVTEGIAPGSRASLDPAHLKAIAADMPHLELGIAEVLGEKYVDLLVKTELLSSKGEAVRLISNGGAYLNEEKVESQHLKVASEHLIGGEYLLLGVGKKKKLLLHIQP